MAASCAAVAKPWPRPYARELPGNLRKDFTATMKLLRNSSFQDLLVNYPRPRRIFYRADAYEDHVSSGSLVREGESCSIGRRSGERRR
jgi:type I restriction enzyme R subunit